MNIDIRLSTGFWQHPKTHRLEKRLGLKGVRSLQILWCWCAQNRPDGNLEGFDASDIEFVADWRGKKGAFVEACAGSWLDVTEAGFLLHEWAEYNPYQSQAGSRDEARKEKARKAANARWHNNNPAECSDDAQAYAKPCSSICSSNAKTDAKQCSDDAQAYAQAMPPVPVPVPEELKGIFKTPPPPTSGGRAFENPPADSMPQDEKPPKRKKQTGNSVAALESAIDAHTQNPELRRELKEYRAMRERIRKPLTAHALDLAFAELEKLAQGDEALQVAIVAQSTLNSWQGLFPLREHNPRASPRGQPKTFAELENERRQEARRKAMEYDRQKELEAQKAQSA